MLYIIPASAYVQIKKPEPILFVAGFWTYKLIVTGALKPSIPAVSSKTFVTVIVLPTSSKTQLLLYYLLVVTIQTFFGSF